jgi:hypothetical protein
MTILTRTASRKIVSHWMAARVLRRDEQDVLPSYFLKD